MSEVNRLEWDAYIRDSELMQSINRIERRVEGMVDNVRTSGQGMEDVFSKMAKAATAFFTLNQAEQFVQKLIQVRSEFQQLDIAFTTMLGNKERADQLTRDIVEFAGTTPFGMKDAANAAKQLLAYGSAAEDVKDELRMLGDVAAGTSQPIGELVYLYGTMRTQGRAYLMDIRQFAGRGIPIYQELAKVLGVNVDQVNDLVSAGKVGFAEVEQAFKNMTAAGSMFGGLMEAQSRTIQGELERLGDAFDMMLNDIGEDTEGFISSSIQGLASLVENYETVLNILGSLIVTYGAYRTALVANAVLMRLGAASIAGMTAQEILHIGAVKAKTAALTVMNAVMAATPVVAMTASLAGLVAVVYSLSQVVDATSAAHEKLNDAYESGAKGADDEKRSIEQLVSVIKDNTASAEQKLAAYNKLQEQTGGILKSFSQEEIAAGKASQALDDYVANVGRAISARSAFDEYNKLAGQLDELNRKGEEGIGIWTKAGRALQNAFGAGGAEAAAAFWGFGDKDMRGGAYILKQEQQSIKAQMDLLKNEFETEFTSFVTGVKKTVSGEGNTFSDALKDPLKNWDALIKGVSNKTELDSLKKAVTEKMEALAPTNPAISKYRAKLEKIAELEKAYSISGKGSKGNQANREFQANERHLSLLADLEKARNDVHNSQLTRDEQEIESTKAKYNVLRNEIRKFNDDPRNKTKIDPKQLDALENQDIQNVLTKQSTERKIQQYQKDYDNYVRYEELKREVSQRYADEQLGIYSNVTEKMAAEYAALAAKMSFGRLNANELNTFNALGKILNNESLNVANSFRELITKYQSYEQERVAIIEKSEREIATLRKAGRDVEADEAERQRDEAILQLHNDQIESSKAYRDLQKQLDQTGSFLLPKALKLGADVMRRYIKGLGLTPAMEKELMDKFVKPLEIEGGISSSQFNEQVASLVGGFDQLVNMASQFDGTMGNTLKTIGQMVGQVASITKAIGEGITGVGKGLASSGSGIAGIIGAMLSVIGSVVQIFEASAQKRDEDRIKRQQYAHETQMKQLDAVTKALELQLQLIKDIYGTQRIIEFGKAQDDANKSFNDSLNNLSGRRIYLNTGEIDIDEMIRAYNNEEITSPFSKVNNAMLDEMFGKGALKDLQLGFTSIQDMTIEHVRYLNKILDSGELDEVSAQHIKNILDARRIYIEATNQMREELTGVSFNQLTNGIVDMFKQGKTSVEDFTEFFESQMQASIIRAFARDSIEQQLQPWYEEFAKLSEDGLTEDEINSLREMYNKLMQGAQKDWEELKKVTGIDLENSNSPNSSSSLSSSGIERITEQSATELLGIWRAHYDITKKNGLRLDSALAIANSQLAQLNGININTAETVKRLDVAVVELKAISRGVGGKYGS